MRIGIRLVIIWVLMSSPLSYAGNSVNVTFLNPDGRGNQFWDLQTAFMQAAATDLGINLEVVYSPGKNRFEYMELAEKILKSVSKPDYFISIFKRGISLNILQIAENEGVGVYTINTDVPDENRKDFGKPRENFKHWIGQMVPDDTQAGYLLANLLIERTRESSLKKKKSRIQVIGMSGSRDSSAALNRNEGLEKAIEGHPDVFLHQIVFTDWDQEESHLKVSRFFGRYPEADLIWCASDGIAMGAIQAIEELGKIPGKHVLTGGIDWSKEGVQAVKTGKMEATIGGHFMEGALALVLLYDYHHGRDFAEELGVRIHTDFHAITAENVHAYDNKLDSKKWDSINFKTYSKTHNSNRKKYNFDLESILGE